MGEKWMDTGNPLFPFILFAFSFLFPPSGYRLMVTLAGGQ